MAGGLTAWALKPGELKRLDRPHLLLFAARVAMRVERWRPKGIHKLWDKGLRFVVDAANGAVVPDAERKKLSRAISDAGAEASYDFTGADEPIGNCMNYATQTLSAAIDATAVPDGAALKKEIILVAKPAGSIPAVLAHGGLIKGKNPVDEAATKIWSVMRDDIATIADAQVYDVGGLRNLGPLWPSPAPKWPDARRR